MDRRSRWLSGRADMLEGFREGDPRLVEVRSGLARRPSTADRLQLAAYSMMLEERGIAVGAELAFTQSRRRERVSLAVADLDGVHRLTEGARRIAEGTWVPSNRPRHACTACAHRSRCRARRTE